MQPPLSRRVAIHGRYGISHFVHRNKALSLLASGQVIIGDGDNLFIVGGLSPDDKSRQSTTTTVLHRREGSGYGLKPVHELAFIGMIGARVMSV